MGTSPSLEYCAHVRTRCSTSDRCSIAYVRTTCGVRVLERVLLRHIDINHVRSDGECDSPRRRIERQLRLPTDGGRCIDGGMLGDTADHFRCV